MAKKGRRICCVEAFWEDEDQVVEPTIGPMLETLFQWKYWPHVHTKCGTIAEVKWFLGKEWIESDYGSVLFFATHGCGSPALIKLSEGESISLRKLAGSGWLAGQCEGRLVHFSACNILEDKDAVDFFLQKTGAAAVSGYGTDVGWAGSSKPALLSDLMLLNQLSEAEIDFASDHESFREPLAEIEVDLQRRFCDCQFRIVQRP